MEDQNKSLQDKIEEVTKSMGGSTTNEKKIKDLNRQLEFQVDELMEQLETSDTARKGLKVDLNVANENIISIEEDLYSSKQIQSELLDQLRECEDKFEEAVHKLEETEQRLEHALELANEVEKLQQENFQLKNSVYIPKKND